MIERTLGSAWLHGYRIVDARERDVAVDAAAARAIVVTGSPHHVHHREPWVRAIEAWLRVEVANEKPILGLCFGHQLLASALGGEVAPNPEGREMGTMVLERLADDPILDGIGASFTANTCHLDTVTRLPADAVVLARSARDRHQAVRFGARAYGVQFHPEFDGDVMRGYLTARRDALTTEGRDADALVAAATDTPSAARVLANFATHVVA